MAFYLRNLWLGGARVGHARRHGQTGWPIPPWVWWVAVGVVLLIGSAAGAKERIERGGEFFDSPTLHRFHVIVSHEGWEAMQPWRGSRRAVAGTTNEGARAVATTRPVLLDVHPHPMGRQYRYVRAVLEHGGKRHGEVGLRFKGNSSYMASERSYKRPMNVDFDRVEEGREFFGVDCLNFNNNALDPSLLREHLSYAMFREAGVPAPRTALAAVTLSVEPLVNEKRLGIYTIVEDVDKAFLKSRFGSAAGLLLKPEGSGAIEYEGENVERYLREYSAKTQASPAVGRRLVEFAKLVSESDDAAFAAAIESFVDVEEYLRFVAVNVLLANYDSYLAMGHNYYVYVHPDTLKVHHIPWDLNMSFGGYVRVPPDSVARCGVERPWIGSQRMIERVLKVAKLRARYREILGELNGTLFEPGRLVARVERLEGLIKEVREFPREPSNPSVARGALAEPPELKTFIRERHASVRAQLAGDVSGAYQARFVHGPVTGFLHLPAVRKAPAPAGQRGVEP